MRFGIVFPHAHGAAGPALDAIHGGVGAGQQTFGIPAKTGNPVFDEEARPRLEWVQQDHQQPLPDVSTVRECSNQGRGILRRLR